MERKLCNYMEVRVEQQIDKVLKNLDICKCEKCVFDIKALALNALPPKYIVSLQGEIFAKISSFQQQYDTDIIIAITTAAKLVGENPKHE